MNKNEAVLAAHILWAYGRSCSFISTTVGLSEYKVRKLLSESGARPLGSSNIKPTARARQALAAAILQTPELPWEVKEDVAADLPRHKARKLWPEFFEQIETNIVKLTNN